MTVTRLHREVLDAGRSDGWSRPPDFERARRIASAKARRAEIVGSARRILSRRRLGADERVLDQLAALHSLYVDYRALGAVILELELL